MAEKLDPRQIVTFEELLRSMMYEKEATRRIFVQKNRMSDFLLDTVRTPLVIVGT